MSIDPSVLLTALSSYTTQVKRTLTEIGGRLDAQGYNDEHVLSVRWEASRANIAGGHGAGDGQLLPRGSFPSAWEAISLGRVPVVSDAQWLANPLLRGCFSTGDGETTFRMPDYNGIQPGSPGAVFMRGDGLMSAGAEGNIQRDAMQNLKGTVAITRGYATTSGVGDSGVFGTVNGADTTNNYQGPGVLPTREILFDASKVARTADENRPIAVTGVWTVRLFGEVVNAGSMDAAQLASDYANMVAQVGLLAAERSVGWGQQYRVLTGQRAYNTVYVNPTDRPIFVHIFAGPASSANVGIRTNKNLISPYAFSGGYTSITFLVGSGEEYSAMPVNGTLPIHTWNEYRA